jgi:quercetin dioxygenase-like cupin family protein
MQATTVRRFPHIPAGTGETYNVIGELLTFKLTSKETDGQFSVMELLAQPGGGPPLHTHPSTETFTIQEGEFEFFGLDEGAPYTIRATPGDTVFMPSGAAHTYKAVGDTAGRAMLVFTPGTEMEGFFAEAGVRVSEGQAPPAGPPDMPALLAVAAKYGQTFVAP